MLWFSCKVLGLWFQVSPYLNSNVPSRTNMKKKKEMGTRPKKKRKTHKGKKNLSHSLCSISKKYRFEIIHREETYVEVAIST